jgi:glycosyltransferase involved in cell wall biosynthesis
VLRTQAQSNALPEPSPPGLASVVVPTRNRPDSLLRCLAALETQLYEPLEVIVVDDASEDGAKVATIVSAHRARLVRGPGRGPAAARNLGVREASGDFLCFTDDDCEPEPQWVDALVSRLRAGADAVAGATLSIGSSLATASELAAHAPWAVAPPPGSDIAFAPTNNLACKRTAFDTTPFDESFPDAAGEDREWCARLLEGGHVLVLESGARIIHRQQLTLGSFLRQQARYGRGAFRFRRSSGTVRAFESAGFYGALLREGFRQGAQVGLLLAAAQVATAVGYAEGWWEDSDLAARVRRRRRNGDARADGG